MSVDNIRSGLRTIFSLSIVAGVLIVLWSQDGEGLVSRYYNGGTALTAMIVCTFVYILLMAVPFVPGMELGWLLMGAFGTPGILAAWLGTVTGLTLGFALSRRLRNLPVMRTLAAKRSEMSATNPADLTLAARLLRRSMMWQQRHPYMFLLVALNIPGNLVIGGGGGIAWISGQTPGVGYRSFIPVTALATAAVPLLLLAGLANVMRR